MIDVCIGKGVMASVLEADCICITVLESLWGGCDICGDTHVSLNHKSSTHNIRRHTTEGDLRMVTKEQKGTERMMWGNVESCGTLWRDCLGHVMRDKIPEQSMRDQVEARR
jgi:hypothetical protein